MIIFLHIPKTAGTTFQSILERGYGISHCHTNHTKKPSFRQADLDFAKKLFPGLKSIAGHNLINPLQLSTPEAFHMTFLRDPVARVFSYYQDSVTRGGNKASFEETFRTCEGYQNFAVKMMTGGYDLEKAKHYLERCSFVGFTEKFDLSLHVFKKLYPGRLDVSYKRKVVAPDDSVKKVLMNDPKMVALAKEHNQLDIELHTFATDEIFPRLCERAGVRPSDPVPSFDTFKGGNSLKFLAGRFLNKSIYRQICKLR